MSIQKWSLATAVVDGREQVVVRSEEGSLHAPRLLSRWSTVMELLAEWHVAEDLLRDLDPLDAPALEGVPLVAPLQFPRAVLCAGVNYQRHLTEMGVEVPSEGWYPFFFLKPPTTTVIGPYDEILVRDEDVRRYDWEAELAVVIGTGGRDIDVESALAHVAGYAVANDVTARGLHRRDVVPGPPFTYDWFASKAIDASLPLGPGITPAFLIPDPHDLRLRLWVNGKLEQDDSTADMICSIPELIAEASRLVTLQPGDVIITGTPAGVGSAQGRFLRDGDVVRVEATGLGHIENLVRHPVAAVVAAAASNGVRP